MLTWQPTPELLIRDLRPADAGAVHQLIERNRAHLDRWLRWSSGMRTVADAQGLIEQFQAKLHAGDGFHCGLWVDGQLAGGVVCWYIHRHHRNAEIGYWLGESYLRRGLATRASAQIIDHLFRVEGLHRVEMQCGADNRASRAVPERLGFRLEGLRRESHWITTRFVDHCVYGLLSSEWNPPTAGMAR
jgi:ribosomal-protein-serine acetyltransferase